MCEEQTEDQGTETAVRESYKLCQEIWQQPVGVGMGGCDEDFHHWRFHAYFASVTRYIGRGK